MPADRWQGLDEEAYQMHVATTNSPSCPDRRVWLRRAYEAGARAARERDAALLRDPEQREMYVLLGPRVIMHCATAIDALPLPDPEAPDAG